MTEKPVQKKKVRKTAQETVAKKEVKTEKKVQTKQPAPPVPATDPVQGQNASPLPRKLPQTPFSMLYAAATIVLDLYKGYVKIRGGVGVKLQDLFRRWATETMKRTQAVQTGQRVNPRDLKNAQSTADWLATRLRKQIEDFIPAGLTRFQGTMAWMKNAAPKMYASENPKVMDLISAITDQLANKEKDFAKICEDFHLLAVHINGLNDETRDFVRRQRQESNQQEELAMANDLLKAMSEIGL